MIGHMTKRTDTLVRFVGDCLVVLAAGSVALAQAHPNWAWVAVAVSVLKMAQKVFVNVTPDVPQDAGAKLP